MKKPIAKAAPPETLAPYPVQEMEVNPSIANEPSTKEEWHLEGPLVEPIALKKVPFSTLPRQARRQIFDHLRKQRRTETVGDETFTITLPVEEVYRFDKGFVIAAYAAGTSYAHSEILYWYGSLQTIDTQYIATPFAFHRVGEYLQIDYDRGCCDGRYRYRTWFAKQGEKFTAAFSTLLEAGNEYYFGRIQFHIQSEFAFSKTVEPASLQILAMHQLYLSTRDHSKKPGSFSHQTEFRYHLGLKDGRLISCEGLNPQSRVLLDSWQSGRFRGPWSNLDGPIQPFVQWMTDRVEAEELVDFISYSKVNAPQRQVLISRTDGDVYTVLYPKQKKPFEATLMWHVDLNGDGRSDKILSFMKECRQGGCPTAAYLSLEQNRYLEILPQQEAAHLIVDYQVSHGMRTMWKIDGSSRVLSRLMFNGKGYVEETISRGPTGSDTPSFLKALLDYTHPLQLNALQIAAVSEDQKEFVVVQCEKVDADWVVFMRRFNVEDSSLLEELVVDDWKETREGETVSWKSVLSTEQRDESRSHVKRVLEGGAYSVLEAMGLSPPRWESDIAVGVGRHSVLLYSLDSPGQLYLLHLLNRAIISQTKLPPLKGPAPNDWVAPLRPEPPPTIYHGWSDPKNQYLLLEIGDKGGTRRQFKMVVLLPRG